MATETVERTRCDVCNKVKDVAHVEATMEVDDIGEPDIKWAGDMCNACWERAKAFFARGTTPPKKRTTT